MENLLNWDDVPKNVKAAIIIVFTDALQTDSETVLRIFNLAKPKVVVEKNFDYWRIEKENGGLLRRLLAEYL